MRPSAFLFFFTGAGMLAALPWIDGPGLYLWFATKVAYLAGVVFFILKK